MKKTTLVSMIALLTPFIGRADTVVTSKTYVDAKVSSSNSISSTSTTTAPNEAAVYGALQSAQSAVNNVLTSVVSDNDTTHAPTGDAVYDELAGKQGNIGGSTDSGKAVIATETAGTVAYKTIKTAVDSSSDLITAGAVKTYADSKVSSSNAISSTSTTTAPNEAAVYGALQSVQSAVNNVLTSVVSDNDTTHAPTGDAVYDELAGKQGNIGGSTDSGKAVIATETAGTVAYKTIKTAVDSSSDLITAGAVKTYADSKVSSSNSISSTSTTTAPNEAAVYSRISGVESSVTSLQSDVTALQSCTHACADTGCTLITVSCVSPYGA